MNSSLTFVSTIFRLIAAVALLALATACATPGPPPVDTSQLLAVGFKVLDAKTPTQVERLQALPSGKLTEWQNTGKQFYVYPDFAKNSSTSAGPRNIRLTCGSSPAPPDPRWPSSRRPTWRTTRSRTPA